MPMLTMLRIRLPVWPFQSPLRTRFANPVILSSTAWTCGHHVLAVHHDGRAARRTQGHVQHGAVLRDVDPVAAEHGVDPRPQPGLLRQLEEQPERLVGDAVLRVVEIDADGLGAEPLAALRIRGEEIAQMQLANRLVMSPKGLPGGTPGQGKDALRHARLQFQGRGRRSPCSRARYPEAARIAADPFNGSPGYPIDSAHRWENASCGERHAHAPRHEPRARTCRGRRTCAILSGRSILGRELAGVHRGAGDP